MSKKFELVSVLSVVGFVLFIFSAIRDVFFGIYSELLSAVIIGIFAIVLLMQKELPTDEYSGKLLKIANVVSHPLIILGLIAVLVCQFTFLRLPHFGESYIRGVQLLLFLAVGIKEEELRKRKNLASNAA